MPTRVLLDVLQGQLAGQQFVFEERTTCIIGRAKDCQPQIPNVQENRRISRHHCLLDINPPDVRIRDFGSLNGTYVNGRKIGQRPKEQQPGETPADSLPEYDLKHGDEIRLGNTLIRVSIAMPIVCSRCAAEIAPADLPAAEMAARHGQSGQRLCAACWQNSAAAQNFSTPRYTVCEPVKLCAKCHRDVSQESGANREGEFICSACRNDPMELLKKLLGEAVRGNKKLVAIEGYELLKELGRGGMGAVYLARHKASGKQVALKVMLPKVAASPRATESFLRETANTRLLKHPNVVQLWDAGSSEGTFFFTLEFCDGGSVDKLVRQRGGKLSIDEARPIILQALEGLEYAHNVEISGVKLKDGGVGRGRGLVHRDLKPQNIFLSGGGCSMTAKLGDYGLAKAFDLAGLSGHTFTGDVAGTPQFMPRQQVLHFREVKPEVDVWAMAATFYYMLTGRAPRAFAPDKDAWQTILQTDAVPIRQRNPAVPDRLAAVVDQALVDRPEIGFKSAAQLKQALQKVL